MKRFFALVLFLLAAASAGLAQAAPAPAAAPDPLPDIPVLLHQVELARLRNTVVAEQYFYNATRTTHDSKGNAKTETWEISFINGVRIGRLIARNGIPLSAEDAAKENARVDKIVAKAKARKVEAQDKGVETDSNGDKLITLERLLQLYTMSNERRELLHGRSTIAIDFTGNPVTKTHGIPEAILHTFSGTVWIDERDHQVAKMSGTSKDGYRAGFGLIVNISKGLGGTVEFAPVNGEVWLPMRMEGAGHIRVLLFADELDGPETDVFSNFRKFTSNIKILPATGNDMPEPAKQ